MNVYLPLAEVAFNGLLLILISASVSVMAGLFGIGGGFIMTPTLIALGIPPSIAVGSQASQVTTASVVAFTTYFRKKNVDIPLGLTLSSGGLVGVLIGVWLFKAVIETGQSEFFIRSLFAVFLIIISVMMASEYIGKYIRLKKGIVKKRKIHKHNWAHGLPFKVRYHASCLYMSALLPLAIGLISGIMTALMGVGGGFILVPALVYLLGVSTLMAIGTSLMQIIIVTAQATIFHSWINHTLDVILAALLLVGSVIGARAGAWIAERVRAQELKLLLALLLGAVGVIMLYSFLVHPENIFSIKISRGGL